MASETKTKYFANGAGCAKRYKGSDVLLFWWHGRDDGTARYIPHVGMYARGALEFRSLAALLKHVAAEHKHVSDEHSIRAPNP